MHDRVAELCPPGVGIRRVLRRGYAPCVGRYCFNGVREVCVSFGLHRTGGKAQQYRARQGSGNDCFHLVVLNGRLAAARR